MNGAKTSDLSRLPLKLRALRANNLKTLLQIEFEVPLTVVTGVSGSGKSSPGYRHHCACPLRMPFTV